MHCGLETRHALIITVSTREKSPQSTSASKDAIVVYLLNVLQDLQIARYLLVSFKILSVLSVRPILTVYLISNLGKILFYKSTYPLNRKL